jgi:hypothetical protein
MWLKYRHIWDSGFNEWVWKHFKHKPNDNDLCVIIDNLGEEHNWSDKYRGVEYKLEEFAPKEIIELKLETVKTTIKHHITYKKYLEEELEESIQLQKKLDKLNKEIEEEVKDGTTNV